ncbi:MAG: hypothetical protein M3517_11600 [Actinomycetota bacterium]|nr:hypothetical protein [Actinomycetota bacterium]
MSNVPPPPPGGFPPPHTAPPQPGQWPQSGAPPSSPKRSRTPWIVAVLAVVALVAAGVVFVLVSRDDDSTPPDLSESQLESALLTTDDVGEGFTEEPPDEDDDSPMTADDIEASEECTDFYEQFSELEDQDPDVGRELGTEGERISVQHEISLPNEGMPPIELIDEFVEACPEVNYDDGESSGTIRFDLGDPVDGIDSPSRVLEYETEITEPFDVEATSTLVIWERDGITSTVVVTEFEMIGTEAPPDDGSDPPPPDELAKIADGRLADVIAEAG